MIRLMQADTTIFNNEAKVCYDWIITFLALLCCQYFRLASSAADFLLAFLFNAEHHFQTCYDTSKKFFFNASQTIVDVLQGSRSALVTWLAMSLVLIKTYKLQFPTEGIPNSAGDLFLQKTIDAFVANANLWDILPESTSTSTLLH